VGEANAEPVWIDRKAFASGEATDGVCPKIIDVTGRARRLFGAALGELAPGLWRAGVVLELCPDAARRALVFEFGVGEAMTTRSIPLGRPGRFEFCIEHEFKGDGPAELALELMKPAYHGSVRLVGAKIEQLSAHG
jgi:hypothetical protein